MRFACLVLATVLAVPVCADEIPKDPPVTRISYWTTRPGKGHAANAFWKQFTPVFDEMKAKGLITEWTFVTPEIHAGEDWDLAYIWRSRDWAAYGEADQYFSAAIAKMDGVKIETDFDAAFDGSKHRDEIWEGVGVEEPRGADASAPGVYIVGYFSSRAGHKEEEVTAFWRAGTASNRELQRAGLLVEWLVARPALHTGQEWDVAVIRGFKDMASLGAGERAFRNTLTIPGVKFGLPELFDLSKHRDAVWKRVEMK